jgi:hypothetical protein
MNNSTLKYDFGLPNKLSGKTFAEASKAIEKTFKNRMSVIDLRTKDEFMSRLKDAQEKQREELDMSSSNEMAPGGWDNSTDYTSELDNVDTGGSALSTTWFGRTFGNNSKFGEWIGEEGNQESVLGGIGLAASALAPMISNRRAMKDLKVPTKVEAYTMDENQYQPQLVNRQQLLRNAAEQAATQRFFIGQAGGNATQQSALMANLNANRLISTGNLMLQSDLADAQEKARIQGLKANIQSYNLQQQQRADEINEQNLAAYYNTLTAYKQASGANIATVGQSLFNAMQAKKYGRSAGNAATFRTIGT